MSIIRQSAGRFAVTIMALLMATISAFAEGQQRGKASYYSKRCNGARTSSGIRLNNDSLVCAHKTHPFGTKLLVKNPVNGKQVVVKVIDRGPHVRGRIIDLSHEAARRLGIIAAGVAMVEGEVYNDTEIPYAPKPYEKPEVEFEIPAKGIGGTVPDWQKKDDEESKTK